MVRDDEKQLIRECIDALREGIPGFKSRRPQMEMIAARVPTGITALGRKGHFVVEIRFGDGLACWLPLKTDPLRAAISI